METKEEKNEKRPKPQELSDDELVTITGGKNTKGTSESRKCLAYHSEYACVHNNSGAMCSWKDNKCK